jgi:hypothetical protein
MGLEDACSGQDSLLFEPPEVYYLFPTWIVAAVITASELNTASISGNSENLDAIIHALDLDTDKHGDQFLMPILGDQLTVQRL